LARKHSGSFVKTLRSKIEGPIRRTREGGSEWEPIKILFEGDEDSNKMNTASNTRLRLTTQVGQAHVATGPRNQQKPFRAKTHQHAQRKLARLAACAAPVRPVTPVRPVDGAGQAGGYSSHRTSVPESLSDFSRPLNKNTLKTQPARKENPTQNLTNQLQTDQEETSNTKTQRHTSQAVHSRQIPQVKQFRPVKSTGQTGVTWAARDEQHPRVNSSKSKLRSPESLHGLEQDFVDSRSTS
jgi:hypothetical protein